MAKTKAAPFDKRLLEPGWAGEPEPAELAALTARLAKRRRLASKWGCGIPSQTDWAILQVAMWGDPDLKPLNAALARQRCDVPYGLQLPLF